MKNPIKPYKGECHLCGRMEWLDVAGVCTVCFALMDYEEQSAHAAHLRWIRDGRPVDTDDPWAT